MGQNIRMSMNRTQFVNIFQTLQIRVTSCMCFISRGPLPSNVWPHIILPQQGNKGHLQRYMWQNIYILYIYNVLLGAYQKKSCQQQKNPLLYFDLMSLLSLFFFQGLLVISPFFLLQLPSAPRSFTTTSPSLCSPSPTPAVLFQLLVIMQVADWRTSPAAGWW